MQKKIRRTQQERRAEAQSKVIASARSIFAEKGYQQASLEDIANHCGLTTRPVYHYFGNKQGLFKAVTEQIESELAAQFLQAISQQSLDLHAGWSAFITMCKQQDFRQIVLLDAPNVLGRQRWEKSEVVQLAEQALAPFLPASSSHATLITRMLLVSLAEAALVIAENSDTDNFIQAANDIVEQLLNFVSNQKD